MYYIDFSDLDFMNFLEGSLNLWFSGFSINDVHHGILVFHLLHILFSDQWVFEDILMVESLNGGACHAGVSNSRLQLHT